MMFGLIDTCRSRTVVLMLLTVGKSFGYLFPIEPRGPLEGTPSPPGSPWPLPHNVNVFPDIVSIGDRESFHYMSNIQECSPLKWFTEKFTFDFLFGSAATPDPRFPLLSIIAIEITSNEFCETFPKLDDDESYTLSISGNEPDPVARIVATTVWGALRGLATLTELFYDDLEDLECKGLHFYANITEIQDGPRFPHRGVMIDTARHYLPERIIHQIMDAMFYNKLNVLHWHIVDDQSFPYVSRRLPLLSLKGAYHEKAIYSPEMVNRTLEFARVRGIRIILEFDTPGHTHAMGKGYPELLTPCYGDGATPGTPNYPNHAAYENLDPTKESTYEAMRELYTEISEVSQDEYTHLGMDEVYQPCWSSSPIIRQFMQEHGYQSISQVQAHYTRRHLDMVKSLGLKPIIWQDPIDAGVQIDTDVVIEIWKDWQQGGWPRDAQKALDKGHHILVAAPWYINYISYGMSWKSYYEVDLISNLPNLHPGQEELVLGGEACIWGEYVDKTNIVPRLFPYVSAVAEKLWSKANTSSVANAMWRLDQHRCRLLRRGIPAQPILNGYCGQWETDQQV